MWGRKPASLRFFRPIFFCLTFFCQVAEATIRAKKDTTVRIIGQVKGSYCAPQHWDTCTLQQFSIGRIDFDRGGRKVARRLADSS
jgi:hypothetical protein